MIDRLFAEADAPVEALRIPRPTLEQVDNHPDSAFIWAVIVATRLACMEANNKRVVGLVNRRPMMG